MREAVVVSTARTPIGKAYRGAFNDTQAQDLAGHAIEHAVARAGISGSEVDDVVFGAAIQQGTTGFNVARQAALRAGLPDTVAGMSVDRQCASGLMAITIAAKQIVHDGMDITVGGGVESISLAQNDHMNSYRAQAPWLLEHHPDLYMPMLETAEIVAEALRRRASAPGRVRAALPGAHRGRPGGRQVRRRDRPDDDHQGGGGQGDR